MPIVIDGYNLLRTIQKTGEDFSSLSDIQLCRVLDRYLKAASEKGEIVFDGTGPRDKSDFDSVSRLDIFFSGIGVEADAVIENKIRINTAPKRLVVVSNDRRLRDAARRRKAISVKCEAFWANVQSVLSRPQTAPEPAEKQTGLNESETKKWLEFFGFD